MRASCPSPNAAGPSCITATNCSTDSQGERKIAKGGVGGFPAPPYCTSVPVPKAFHTIAIRDSNRPMAHRLLPLDAILVAFFPAEGRQNRLDATAAAR